ncbi:putative alkaline phosphatase family protein [Golovinomyces cichoracearum]|uniref:Putative alkaline phosphatase family protein n=1 Tax=Golovinomyces cichoracearum TaxID=62708 RepID=A0A420HMN2_9PEZI|nr:putative alkaline phosphatase family protein [Golovinomyces cichoracearum]
MANLLYALIVASCLALRISAYIFLRWIPSHQLPILVYTSAALYVSAFISSFARARNSHDQLPATIIQESEKGQGKEDRKTGHESTNYLKTEVRLKKKIIRKIRPTNPWHSLLTGLPNSKSALLSAVTLAVNFTLVLAVADLVYRAKLLHPANDLSFARIGYISPTEAKLVIREPDASKSPVSISYRPVTPSKADVHNSWQSADTIISFGNDTDYTKTVTLSLQKNLEQTYQWKTSTNHTGFFTTPPYPGSFPSNEEFSFLTSSCIKARFPYNPLTHPLTISGFKYMSQVLKSFPKSQFMLFLGDFIYIDVPKRFGTTVEDYRREYRQVYSSPEWPLVGQNLSWIHVLDDHEIDNDWDRRTTGVYNAAVDPWHHYQTAVNPPTAQNITESNELTYFEFTQGPASFFMLDTRTYRHPSRGLAANAIQKSMLGSTQLSCLLAFLRKPEVDGVKWKFVISSIPFTKNWRVNSLDTWAGYLYERKVILEAMWDASIQNGVKIVVLSGDRHEFAATAFPPPAEGKWPSSSTVHEFSVGPLSQFYLPVPTYKQLDNEDVEVKLVVLFYMFLLGTPKSTNRRKRYIPNGNSKLGIITIKKVSSEKQSILQFHLYIDGQRAWSHTLSSLSLI